MATAADTDLASFLQNFHKSRNMKNTMLFVMGAHGTRYGAFTDKSNYNFDIIIIIIILIKIKLLEYGNKTTEELERCNSKPDTKRTKKQIK